MKVVIFGSGGMLGTDLVETFRNYELYPLSKNEVDITSKKSVFENISKLKPDFIINAAAYTDVDGSNIHKNVALKANATAVKYLALASKKYGATLVHFSTDYVFDGRKKKGYTEESEGNPINFYGLTKFKGEQYIQSICQKYYIIRTQWLFGKCGNNFVETIIQLSNEKKEIHVVDDQYGSPTYTKDLAKEVKNLISNYSYGVYHITNQGVCSWYDFAKLIVRLINTKTKVIRISSNKSNRLAKRPKYSILVNTKIRDKMRDWQSALKDCLSNR